MTRRSISVKGTTYARLEKGGTQLGRSVSGLVEDAVAAFLDGLGVPEVTREEVAKHKPRERDAADDDIASGIFTF